MLFLAVLSLAASCVRREGASIRRDPLPAELLTPLDCAERKPMRVVFFDVAQGLSALVLLPDGRKLLVDLGDSEKRPGCGAPCREAAEHLSRRLRALVEDRRLDLVWITHPHSDHLGGAPTALEGIQVRAWVDNGEDLGKPTVSAARAAAITAGAAIFELGPSNRAVPLADNGPLKFSAAIPEAWPLACHSNPNDCSLALRIDYCESSILFTGDAEETLEAELPIPTSVDLIQVGHHGSRTSCTDGFLERAKPRYAVISSGKRDVGTNKTYCHPRRVSLDRLSRHLGEPGQRTVAAFEGESCRSGTGTWSDVAVSDRLWHTARDGDVVLETVGDGEFARIEQ